VPHLLVTGAGNLDPSSIMALLASMGLGGGQGGAPGAPAAIQSPSDMVKELQQAFSSGQQLHGNDAQVIQAIMQDTGLPQNQASTLYYQARKPFEPAGGPSATIGPAKGGNTDMFAGDNKDQSGFMKYPDGTLVKNDPFNPKKHGGK